MRHQFFEIVVTSTTQYSEPLASFVLCFSITVLTQLIRQSSGQRTLININIQVRKHVLNIKAKFVLVNSSKNNSAKKVNVIAYATEYNRINAQG